MQAYAGDELGYSETPITQDMRIAIVDVGAVDGADIVTRVESDNFQPWHAWKWGGLWMTQI